jgi:transcriptional regulator with XRE-family HTH domain
MENNRFKQIRKAAKLSHEGVAKLVSIATGRPVNKQVVYRFEEGGTTRDKQVLNGLRKFYRELTPMKGMVIPNKKIGGCLSVKAKPSWEEELRSIKPVHIKDGSVFSTPIDRAGISTFPEGKYLLEIGPKGTQIVPLAAEANPLDTRLETMKSELEATRGELEKFRKGHDSWSAMKDLIKD